MRNERGAWILDLLAFIAFLGVVAVFVLVFSSTGHTQTPPLTVLNCVRPQGKPCVKPFDRTPYPVEFVNYEFYEARETFEQQARAKLRIRHPETSQYRFEIGDLSIPPDKVEWGRRAQILDGKVLCEQQYVALPGWLYKNDSSAKLFAYAWLSIWNAELVEPFSQAELAWMVQLIVANSKFHIGQERFKGISEYFHDWREKRRWVWRS